jgi:hypothetical protein
MRRLWPSPVVKTELRSHQKQPISRGLREADDDIQGMSIRIFDVVSDRLIVVNSFARLHKK